MIRLGPAYGIGSNPQGGIIAVEKLENVPEEFFAYAKQHHIPYFSKRNRKMVYAIPSWNRTPIAYSMDDGTITDWLYITVRLVTQAGSPVDGGVNPLLQFLEGNGGNDA